MKKIALIATLIVVVICSAFISIPKTTVFSNQAATINEAVPSFAYLKTHRFGRNGATADWSLNSNSGVTNFILQRTYEDPTDPYSVWEDICNMPCGNGRNFRHNDVGLSPGFISYRVMAMSGGTTIAVSEISTIQILQH